MCFNAAGAITLSSNRPQQKVPGLGRCFPLELTEQLFQGGTLHPSLYQLLGDYPWLVYGDHMAFWADAKAPNGQGLPAIFLTDTGRSLFKEFYYQIESLIKIVT